MLTRTMLALAVAAAPVIASAGPPVSQSSGPDGFSQSSPMPKVATNDKRNVSRAERRCQAVGPRNVMVCMRKPRTDARPRSELSTADDNN